MKCEFFMMALGKCLNRDAGKAQIFIHEMNYVIIDKL